MASPTWQAPTSNSTFNSGQITQFETSHPSAYIYTGSSTVAGPGSATSTVATDTGSAFQYISQPFTTAGGQTTITRVEFTIATVGGGGDFALSLYTNNSGNPGSQVGGTFTVTVPVDFVPGSAGVVSIPMNITGLTAATLYHLVIAPSSNNTTNTTYCNFSSGAVTGTAVKTAASLAGPWTAGTTTLLFNVYTGTAGNLRHTFEDNGARWTWMTYNGAGNTATLAKLYEYTAQNGTFQAGVGRSVRSMSYTSGQLTGQA